MQRIIFLFTIIFIFHLNMHAQNKNTISEKVIDSLSKKPIDYATITLLTAEGNKVLNGSITDSLGSFELTGIDTGSYNLSFEFIGYTQKIIDKLHIKEDETDYNIGMIALRKNENTLKDVVVTSQTKLVENKIDKIVYNAENDITSQGGVATDVLKKIPQVSIDADGNVELAGNSGIRFLIDGKPSTAFGSNIADVLQSIPASQIKSIEV